VKKSKGYLVTGATGFLGAYLARELLRRTESPVLCLARPEGVVSGLERLTANVAWIFGEDEARAWPWERVEAVEGDLGQDCLGLSLERYSSLSLRISGIYNAAAMLWHFGQEELFSQVNVQGALRLAALAGQEPGKALNHVSTLAVCGRRRDNPRNSFGESDFRESLDYPNVYVKTKHLAEKALRDGLSSGQNIRVFRPGFLMGDSRTGRFKRKIELDAQYLQVRGHILMRTAPPIHPDDFMDVTPVDYAAAAIAHISLQEGAGGGTYHVCNPEPVLKGEVWEFIRDYGYPLRFLPAEGYSQAVMDREDELYLKGLQSVLVYLGDYEKSPARFRTEVTQAALAGSGISCRKPDRALMGLYLDYCVQAGFIPSPEDIRAYLAGL
jgi:thioester reductase-like protein